jgi:polyhydroxyalkanoate synthesis regulator phasin
MKELTDKVTGRVKEQFEQVSDSVTQVITAGRGLYFKLSETGGKQFHELVKVGEAKQESGETLVNHLRESLQEIDAKSSANQLKLAALGLINKTLESGEKVFTDLVKHGEVKAQPVSENASNSAAAATKKKATTKAA